MTIHLKNRRKLTLAAPLAALLVAGLPVTHAEDATSHRGMHGGMQKHGTHQGGMHRARHGAGHDGGSKHGGHGKRHGKGQGGRQHRKGDGGHHLFGDHWKTTLTAEQKVQLDRLHVEFAKTKHALKSGIHAGKVQLAVTAIADQPRQEAIDAQINDLLVGEKRLMQAMYSYIAAQRQVLSPEQRVSFDMEVIHNADAGKAEGHHGGGKH